MHNDEKNVENLGGNWENEIVCGRFVTHGVYFYENFMWGRYCNN